jgi:hypothetical protein
MDSQDVGGLLMICLKKIKYLHSGVNDSAVQVTAESMTPLKFFQNFIFAKANYIPSPSPEHPTLATALLDINVPLEQFAVARTSTKDAGIF